MGEVSTTSAAPEMAVYIINSTRSQGDTMLGSQIEPLEGLLRTLGRLRNLLT